MFQGCSAFNQPITFDTSQVTDMSRMFEGCNDFNSTIDFTDTTKVVSMQSMFLGTVFNQYIDWSIQGLTAGTSEENRAPSLQNIINSCTIDSINYSATLNNWAAQVTANTMPYYINVGLVINNITSTSIQHNTTAHDAYIKLTSAPPYGYGWSIADGGLSILFTVTVTVPINTTIDLTGSINPLAEVNWGYVNGLSHTYDTAGDYIITITGTSYLHQSNLNDYLTSVVQWGIEITDYSTAFQNGLNNFTLPTEQLTNVVNMSSMFYGCNAFNQPITFDTSQVTDMSDMFNDCKNLQQDISFNIQNVITIARMFQSCDNFNNLISFTNTTNIYKLADMSHMFLNSINFNQPIYFNTSQATSKVTNMSSMFYLCYGFNQPITWSIQGLTAGSIGALAPSLYDIFYYTIMNSFSYSDTLISWEFWAVQENKPYYIDVGSVVDPYNKLIKYTIKAQAAHIKLTSAPPDGFGWKIIDGGLDTTLMILRILVTEPITLVTIPINGSVTVDWGDETTSDANEPHNYSVGEYTIFISGEATAYGSTVSTFTPYLRAVVNWGNLGITDYSNAFYNCPNNFTLPTQQLTGVTNMEAMFYGCSAFNQPITFDTSLVENMQAMFRGCSAFNQPLDFDTSAVEIMDSMFQDAVSFATPLNAWKLNSLLSMKNIFTHCGFNQSVYSKTLNGWASQHMYLQRNVEVDLVTDSNNVLICHTNAVQAYNLLIGFGWSIVDGGDCTNAPCFLKGTHILTPNGYVRIEKLYAGDVVLTHDGRKVPICKIHRSQPTPSPITLPYRIPKGTQLHSRRCLDDLYLSPEHAILIHSNKMIAMKYIDFQQVNLHSIHYYHIVLPNYYTDTLIANGIVCESYGSAKKSMKQLHDGNYRTLISLHTYYNIIESSHYIM
jgi:surface protein